MRHSILQILVLSTTIFICSCSNDSRKQRDKAEEVLTEVRYYGEEPPGNSVKLFSPAIISTHRNERDITISPPGTEIFYSMVLPTNNLSVIVYLYHDEAFWSDKLTAPFSGQYSDLEPAFSPDGQKLFFVSKRPTGENDESEDWNIWYVNKSSDGWSAPEEVGSPVNTDGEEYYPSVSNKGNLYFTASREAGYGKEDIYLSKFQNDSYGEPVNLGSGINSEKYEFNAFVEPDESYLLFSSFGREDGHGGGDLYISFRINDTTWTDAENLGPAINSDQLDYCPFVSPDGKYLFFTSHRFDPKITNQRKKSYKSLVNLADGIENGLGNIYWVAFDPSAWK